MNNTEEQSKAVAAEVTEDVSGRRHMVSNVLWSWGTHLVLVAAGFIVPRLINDSLGQGLLGVWDLCWSLVSYFTLLQGGIVSAVNRYVARHRAVGDIEGLNIAVSSATCLLTGLGGLGAVLSVVAAYVLPAFMGSLLGPETRDAQWCVLLLGLSFSLELGTAGIAGVIPGCHRWDVHNAIHLGTYGLRTIGMIAALLLGWGLVALAAINLGAELLGRVLRVAAAYRVCAGLNPRLRFVRWAKMREMAVFGGKTFAMDTSDIVLHQTTAVLIATMLGPAALAVFARPRALVHQVGIFSAKLAYVVSPSASALQSTGRHEDIRTLLLRVTRCAACLVLPPVALLAILGDSVLTLWMGTNYAAGPVLAILGIGLAGGIVHDPLRRILAGLDAHGVLSLTRGIAAAVAIVGVWVVLQQPGATLGLASLALVVPCALNDWLVAPMLACRRTGLSRVALVRDAWVAPLLSVIPLVAALFLIRFWAPPSAPLRLGLAAVAGFIILAPLYWHMLVPRSATAGAVVVPPAAAAES